ncbi:MAG TPA: hypothetical protein VJ913_08360 [Actinomycetota bacterium]|nr:hypothetical protein [Actinomycetota bacterium]
MLATKMVSALLDTGLPAETIEHAAAEGMLSFQRTDESSRAPATARRATASSGSRTPS